MKMMSGSAAASQVNQHLPRTSAVPVLDAQAAELKAERLWGMADARKPASMERKNGVPEVSQVVDRSTILRHRLCHFSAPLMSIGLYCTDVHISRQSGCISVLPFFVSAFPSSSLPLRERNNTAVKKERRPCAALLYIRKTYVYL